MLPSPCLSPGGLLCPRASSSFSYHPTTGGEESPFSVIAQYLDFGSNKRRGRDPLEVLIDDAGEYIKVALRKWNSLPVPIQGILAVNAGVFIAWQLHPHFMRRLATLSEENVRAGRWWTALTCNFSHENPIHFYVNMSSLITVGSAVIGQLGTTAFAGIVVCSSLFSSIADLLMKRFSLSLSSRANGELARKRASLGFSGCNLGIFTIYCLLFPERLFKVPVQFSVFLEKQVVSATDLLKLMCLGDILGLLLDLTIFPSPIGHAAHLGGIVAGLVSRRILIDTSWFSLGFFARERLKHGIRFF